MLICLIKYNIGNKKCFLLLLFVGFHARRMDNGTAHLSRRFSEDDDGSVGYFVGHDQLDFSRYDEPPPPYTLWKPPEMYIPPGEAPPPYDLSVQLTAPYSSNGRFSYAPADQVTVAQQAIISVHAENQEVSPCNATPDVINIEDSAIANEVTSVLNCSLCTAAEIEMNAQLNAERTVGAVLPPDIQYEESCSYQGNAAVTCSTQPEITVINPDVREEDLVNANIASTSSSCDDNAVPTTSACTCAISLKRGKVYKRHSCTEFMEQNRLKAGKNNDKRFSLYPSVSQENNNLYPDPTVWSGEASESSSSSTPTYDQPTLSPSTSDSSSADADFHRVEQIASGGVPCKSIPNRTSSSREMNFESSRNKDFSDDVSKPPHFQKTLSNLKKFSLIKRKKKKRRFDKPNEISCSFVCQSMTDGIHPTQPVFEDGIDLTARNSTENMSRPLEAINPHIGHKLATSSGARSQGGRPNTISIPGHRQTKRIDGSGHSYLSYREGACSSVVTVSGNTVDCAACCNASSPDSICEDHGPQSEVHTIQSSRSLNRQGISRSGSICSETGERRHHRSAGSSPTSLSRSNHLEGGRYSDTRCASSSHIMASERTRNSFQESDDGTVRHIPVWIANSVALASRHEYDIPNVHYSAIRRSASGGFGESSKSVGDISSPLDFRDSVLSSGSSWEACSHL